MSRRVPLLLTLALLSCAGCKHSNDEVSIGVATSLRAVMPALITAYQAAHPGHHVVASYAASGELTKEVEAGAPLDAVFSAGARPVDELIRGGHADGPSQVVASNELVLVGRKGGPDLRFETLTSLPAGEKLAVGDPRTVPAGEYARDYLQALGEWDALHARLVTGENVAAVLVYAQRSEALAAIVYRTELRGEGDLVILDTAHGPHAPHPQVVAAVVHGGRPEARELISFVASPAGAQVLTAFGFGAP